MPKSLPTALLCTALLLAPMFTSGQTVEPPPGKAYFSSGGETIFSMPILDVGGSDQGSIVRFSPFFNAQGMVNYDLSKSFGLFTGLSIRNQGFIYQVPDTSLRFKFRTYNLGVPVGFKVGTMNHTLVFLGYQLEVPINYKEKRFENEKKEEKFNVWFSDRTEKIFHSVFIGFQGPGSSVLTVRYYLNNFHNKNYTEEKDGITYKPYDGLNANILAISAGFRVFDGRKMSLSGGDAKPKETKAQLGRNNGWYN
ncbi:MAG: hypothetical protein JNL43_13130 [Flavobacteriales bacterium]|nr:hypothetical protein [Flavobacteriales bacterium]